MFGLKAQPLRGTGSGQWLNFTGPKHVADIVSRTVAAQFLEPWARRPSLLLLDEVLAGLNPSEITVVEMIRRSAGASPPDPWSTWSNRRGSVGRLLV
jgi:hypothetical protein